MNPTLKIAMAAAAVLVLVVVGFAVVLRQGPGIGDGGVVPATATPQSPTAQPGPTAQSTPTTHPTTSPAPTPTLASWVSVTPDPSNTCEDATPGCSGPLAAGLHRSWQLDPRLWYVVPTGDWSNSIDSSTIFKLDYGAGRYPYILTWVNPGIAKQTPGCDDVAQPGARDAAAWQSFLTTTTGLVTSTSVPVDLQGSADSSGFEVDVSLDPSWTTMCGDWPYPEIPFIADPANHGSAAYGVDSQGRVHVMVVDAHDAAGQPATLVTEVFGPLDTFTFNSYVSSAQELMHTFRFGCGPSVGFGPCS